MYFSTYCLLREDHGVAEVKVHARAAREVEPVPAVLRALCLPCVHSLDLRAAREAALVREWRCLPPLAGGAEVRRCQAGVQVSEECARRARVKSEDLDVQGKVAQLAASWLFGGCFHAAPEGAEGACLRLLQASASLGQSAAWAALWPAIKYKAFFSTDSKRLPGREPSAHLPSGVRKIARK